MTRRTTLIITGAEKINSRWTVKGKNRRGRLLQFTTTSPRFAKGQKVTVTHHTIRRDGTLEGARFSKLENIAIPRKRIEGKQTRTRTRSFCQLVATILQDFREGLGTRAGQIRVEGFLVKVVPEKMSWFRTPDGLHHVFGRQVAAWMLNNGLDI